MTSEGDAKRTNQTSWKFFFAKKIWDINDQHSLAISTKIIKMIAIDNQPFSIVEDQGFIEVIAHLAPPYT